MLRLLARARRRPCQHRLAWPAPPCRSNKPPERQSYYGAAITIPSFVKSKFPLMVFMLSGVAPPDYSICELGSGGVDLPRAVPPRCLLGTLSALWDPPGGSVPERQAAPLPQHNTGWLPCQGTAPVGPSAGCQRLPSRLVQGRPPGEPCTGSLPP